jgi:sugar phosphate isomerase/epimerase
MEQYEHFRPKIGHVHLKDRTSPTDMACVAVGTGCIPIVDIIDKLKESGYKGWYTIEEYGARHMLEDCETGIRIVSAALTD